MISNMLMLGGGKKVESILKGDGDISVFSGIVLLIFLFVLRAMVVQLAYNKVAPKLIDNWGHDNSNFKPLTFQDALLFTILISFLFI